MSPSNSAIAPARLLFLVNNPAFFVSHRLDVGIAASAAGFSVHVATVSGPDAKQIIEKGLNHDVVVMGRSAGNPLKELVSLWSIYRLFRSLRPDIVHLVTPKCIVFGGIAARLARVPAVVAAVSGMGYVFTGQSLRQRSLAFFMRGLYWVALRRPGVRVIFQNPDDREALVSMGAVRSEDAVLIRGSGVPLDEFVPTPEPADDIVRVLLPARLLWDKGVGEFVEAARLLRARGVTARFVLAGDLDAGNPSGIDQQTVEQWTAESGIEWLGHVEDMVRAYQDCHLVVLPSYREGLPRALLEAAACGRAIVTTDVPGCREVVDHGVNGLLVPARDATALADAVEALIADPERRRAMGRAGRDLAEREFGIEQVVEQHLALYRTLME